MGSLKLAGAFALISAAIHAVVAIRGISGDDTTTMFVSAAVWALIGLGLLRPMSWIAYPAFLIAMIGATLAFASTGNAQSDIWYWGIVAADVAVALILFLQIWRRA